MFESLERKQQNKRHLRSENNQVPGILNSILILLFASFMKILCTKENVFRLCTKATYSAGRTLHSYNYVTPANKPCNLS